MLHPLEKIAKRHFGVTDSLEETGYVLSDGTFLDLTGRHMAAGYERKGDRFVPKKRQPDYLAFQRSIDHRQLPSELFDAVGTREGSAAMFVFLRQTGALRLMPGTGFLVASMPTLESVARVVREWHHAFGNEPLYVDVVNPDGDVRESQEFEQPNLEEVMEFLESKFGGASMGAARGRGRKLPARIREIVEFARKRNLDMTVTLAYVDPWDVQIEEMVDPERVREMVRAIRDADGWPEDLPYPVVTGGATMGLLDGSHRMAAALYAQLPEVPVLVVDPHTFYEIQGEFDLSRFEYVHDTLPHIDELAAANNRKDTAPDRDRRRSVYAYNIDPDLIEPDDASDRATLSGAMPPTLKAFGRELRKLINSPEVFSLLAEGDWGAGGCWILAQTLVEFLGPPAELVAISERRLDDEILVPVSHVAVRFVDMYIDYNGAQTEEELLENLEAEGYEAPEIQEWDGRMAGIARQRGIPCDPRARKELRKHLVRRFGT